MMCLINYLSACRRLKECDKFIKLNGRDNLPEQILAQRDMIQLEKEYYREESVKFMIIFCGITLTLVALYIMFNYGDYLR